MLDFARLNRLLRRRRLPELLALMLTGAGLAFALGGPAALLCPSS